MFVFIYLRVLWFRMRSCNVMRCVNCSRVFGFLCFCLRWCLCVAFCPLCLSCSSVGVCGVYVGVLVWASASVLLQLVDLGQLQLHYILACHYELNFVMLLFFSGVCLRFSGASLGLSVSSARILPMLFVWWYNCIWAFVVALSHLIA